MNTVDSRDLVLIDRPPDAMPNGHHPPALMEEPPLDALRRAIELSRRGVLETERGGAPVQQPAPVSVRRQSEDLGLLRFPWLAHGGHVSRTGLVFPAEYSEEEWERLGRHLRAMEHAVQWWIGDWLRYGETHYGRAYQAALEESDLAYQTLRIYVCVARSFAEVSRRRDTLSWSHHQEVAALEPPLADALLEQAEEHGWNRQKLRDRARAAHKGERIRQSREAIIAAAADLPPAEPPAWRAWQADAADTGLEAGAVAGLILFSPPYNLNKAYNETEDGDWAAYEPRVSAWAAELWRVAADRTRIAVNVATDIWDKRVKCPRDLEGLWARALAEAGWTYRWRLDWRESEAGHLNNSTGFGSVGSPSAPNVCNPTERILVFHKGSWALERHEPADLTTDEHMAWFYGVWTIPAERPERAGHPAPFPDELATRLIKLLTFPGDTVYDPFCGSGTAPSVAVALGRVAWGSDLWPQAVALTQARVALARHHTFATAP